MAFQMQTADFCNYLRHRKAIALTSGQCRNTKAHTSTESTYASPRQRSNHERLEYNEVSHKRSKILCYLVCAFVAFFLI